MQAKQESIVVKRGGDAVSPELDPSIAETVTLIPYRSAWPSALKFEQQIEPGSAKVYLPFQGFDKDVWFDDALVVYNRGGYMIGYFPRGFACECALDVHALYSTEQPSVAISIDRNKEIFDSLVLALSVSNRPPSASLCLAVEGLAAMVLVCVYARAWGVEAFELALDQSLISNSHWRRLLQNLGVKTYLPKLAIDTDTFTAKWLQTIQGLESELANEINKRSAVIPASCLFPKA